ncbi:MAG: glucuronate isomerase, partial [Cyclobacteriaceae bacterium]
HYKWRAMRAFGIDERFITGDTPPQDKFDRWSETVPFTLRNPLYQWTHLELQRYFDIHDLLNPTTSHKIYEKAGLMLTDGNHGCLDLVRKMNVKVICTTDDPVDDLRYHQQFRNKVKDVKVLPTFRPDNAFAITDPIKYGDYIEQLSGVSGISIENYSDLLAALAMRIDYFHENGCTLSDHGLEEFYLENHSINPDNIFKKVMKGNRPTIEEVRQFQQKALIELCRKYHEKGWKQQFHLGAIRNNNTRMMDSIGPDTGFDSIGDYSHARGISRFLDQLDRTDQLAKTILYNLNPGDNEMIATMAGNFNDGSAAGKIQFGSGWWFLDQKDGMEKQMNALSNMGLISQFVGMLTDSRSFLSFPRHEYFRRVLCNLFGADIENGELPNDLKLVGDIIENICYSNALKFFEFEIDE